MWYLFRISLIFFFVFYNIQQELPRVMQQELVYVLFKSKNGVDIDDRYLQCRWLPSFVDIKNCKDGKISLDKHCRINGTFDEKFKTEDKEALCEEF